MTAGPAENAAAAQAQAADMSASAAHLAYAESVLGEQVAIESPALRRSVEALSEAMSMTDAKQPP
jgi:hypothetical protein